MLMRINHVNSTTFSYILKMHSLKKHLWKQNREVRKKIENELNELKQKNSKYGLALKNSNI